MKLHLLTLTGLCLIAGCSKNNGPAGGQKRSMGPTPVTVGAVVQKDMPVEIEAIGNVEASAVVAIKAQVNGELKEVHFEEGQPVKKGQPLFTISFLYYDALLRQAQANLERDKAQAANAQHELERAQRLGQGGVASKEQLDQARAAAEGLAATVLADEAQVDIARTQLGYCHINSPLDGRAGPLRMHAGTIIKANDDNPLVTINRISPIYVTFSVPEQNLDDIRRHMIDRKLTVTAVTPVERQKLGEGELTFINNQIDQATGTITLKATFPNTDEMLWPGQFVSVRLQLSSQKGAIVVPSAAVQTGQRGLHVFVVKEDKTVELRSIEIERTAGSESVIKKGLTAGETVVTDGQFRLVPGAPVEIKETAAGLDEKSTTASANG